MSSCLTPLTLVRTIQKIDGSITDTVPCGRCPKCLQRRRTHWVFRLKEQKKVSETSAFLTLTYEDHELPFSDNGYPTLHKTDFQNFLKRLRMHIKRNYPSHIGDIKYFACGEYGGETYRPHYHAIIFNIPNIYLEQDTTLLTTIWTHGYVQIDLAEPASMAYVAGYCMKTIKLTGRDDLDDRHSEFSLMSKKMGIQYLTKDRLQFYKNIQVPYLILPSGQKMAMPRYFKEKIYTKIERQQIAKQSLAYAEEKYKHQSEEFKHEYIKQKFRDHDRILQLKRKII